MSKKTPIRDHLSEENVDSSAPIRRSSRISLSQNPVSSPAPKSVVTRRSSASSISDQNKAVSVDGDTSSPARERRKNRKTSTEEEIKPTPIKTRRTSVSKIIEEEKKVLSSPNTPSRRITRAISTSPTTVDVPARRTRRSMSASQENEVAEDQLPLKRSTRRRSSVDTQEDATNEETPGKSKPSTRRRRSTSVDEKEEPIKNDIKQKIKKLHSEDNQLEPIEEQETETTSKSREKNAEISAATKKGLDLSAIEESDDTETEESKKIINDIDDLLKNNVSSPVCNTQGIIRSIFSPLTPKISTLSEQKTVVDTKDQSSDVEGRNETIQNISEKLKSSTEEKSKKELIVSEVQSESEVEESHKSRLLPNSSTKLLPLKKSLDKETTLSATKKGSGKEIEGKTEKILSTSGNSCGIAITDKAYLSTGSDDSFTLHLNMSLDKTQFPESNDDVFSSPGSNKENNSINIPRKSLPKKNEDHVVQKESIAKRINVQDVEVDIFASKKATRDSFVEPMDIDCDMDTGDSSKVGTPKATKITSKMISPEKSEPKKLDEQNQDSPEICVQKVTEDHEKSSEKDTTENSKAANTSLCESPKKMNIGVIEKSLSQTEESEDDGGSKKLESTNTTMSSNVGTENSFIHINSFQSDNGKMDSSFDMLKISSPSKKSVTDKKEKESDDDMSSDVSIRIVDTDEENQDVTEDNSVVEEKTLQSYFGEKGKGSKRPRISDGTSSKIIQQLSQMKEKDSISSEVEISVSEHPNNSTREDSDIKEATEETTNKDAEKMEPELVKDEKAPRESSMRRLTSSHSTLEEQEPSEDKNAEKESPKRKSPVQSLKDNDERWTLNVQEHETDGKSPSRSSRISSRENPEQVGKRFDAEEPNFNVKDNKGGEKSSKEKSSKLNSQKDEEREEDFGREEMKCVGEIESLKNSDIEKMEMNEDNSSDESHTSDNRSSKLEGNQDEQNLYSRQSSNEKFDEKENETKTNENEETLSIENRKESTSSGRKLNSCQSSKDKSIDKEKEPENTIVKEQKQIKNNPKFKKSEYETKRNKDKNEQKKIAKYSESSGEEISTSRSKKMNKTNTDTKLEPSESTKGDESSEKYSEEETENTEIMNTKNNTSIKLGESENLDKTESSNRDSFASGMDSTTDNSHQKLSKDSENESKKSKKRDSLIKSAESPLKTKMEKMKACGVNFVNPTPTKCRIKLDDETSAKIDDYLSKKLGIPQNKESDPEEEKDNEENDSEDGNESMSEDYESKSGFLDDMAEEGEEDTPSEGSNDIIDEGESINSTESEFDSDETYDSNDSFLVKDDGEDLELLSGEEYDLEVSEEYGKVEQKPIQILPKRKRIIQNENLTSDEDSAVPSPRVSFSEKVEVIHKRKSKGGTPSKPIETIKSPAKSVPKKNTHENSSSDLPSNEKSAELTATNLQTKLSPRKSASGEIPSIQVDLVEDSSDEEGKTEEIELIKTENTVREKLAFEDRIRSLVEGEKSSTPNSSFSEAPNTSRHNTSARSSSIIVHENVSINEIKDGFLAEKLQQVVNVFCAGIRTSDGNISMNVSLDYVENTPKTSASANSKVMDDVVICIEDEENLSETEKKSPKKVRRSLSRCDDNKNDSLNQQGNLRKRRKSSNVFIEKTTKESSVNIDNVEETINSEDFSLLNASLSEESCVQDQNNTIDYERSKKKRRSSGKIERRLSNNKNAEECSSPYKNNSTEMEEHHENIIEDTPIWTEEIQRSNSSKKKRRSSLKMEKQKESTEYIYKSPSIKNYSEKSLEEERSPKQKLKENSESGESFRKLVKIETAKNKKNKSQSTENISKATDDPEFSYSKYEENSRGVENTAVTDEGNEQVKKKKKRTNKKRKHTEGVGSEPVTDLMTSKRMKLLDMVCEELSADDLRHRLPSRNELSNEPQTRIKSKKLKRLQSKLKSDLKSTLVSGLITDVKNRPRRIMKPSVQMDEGGWVIEEDHVKPSAANVAKCTFNFKKIDSKDFKNQMLFDPRIKREKTSTFLRKKGYFV